MALQEYIKKRSFKNTPEPSGGKPTSSKLEFVVQKHAASHLHYDFRLEIRGVLKSWAIPKGPSMDPSIKHLAMLVEDHPFDYKDFEGIIPQGQYGGGTVIVWDQGTYEPLEPAKTKADQEKIMLKEFYSGSIKIRMHGNKLKGEFALVRTQGRGENAWLIIKHRDEYATTQDITLKDKSVLSKKTLQQLSKDKKASVWTSKRAEKWNVSKAKGNSGPAAKVLGNSHPKVKSAVNKKSPPAPGAENSTLSMEDIARIVRTGNKQAMPGNIAPMLCTLTKEPIDDPEYLYEIKWDGYRIISYVSKGKVRMDSRSAKDYTARYPVVVEALKNLGHDIVLDGEVVVFNEDDLPDFDALQLYNGHSSAISYCVFDLLWLDGYNLMGLPLQVRKELLESLLSNDPVFRFSISFDNGPALYEQMVARNLEGIVAKRKDSSYVPDERANNWLKTPTRKRQEFVVGGWAESDKARSFKSLLFGAYNDDGKFEWIGRSGGGYKEKEMPGILKQLTAIETDQSPFTNKVLDTKGAVMHWVKPKLVANFEFATWTKSGRIRKPATFLGFRKDKKANQVVREIPKAVKLVEEELGQEEVPNQSNTKRTKKAAPKGSGLKKKPSKEKILTTMSGSNWPRVEAQPMKEPDTLDIGTCSIDVYSVDRELWKGISKARLLEYYHEVACYILPHLRDRPQSLHIKLTNAVAPGLYIKDMEGRQPECAQVFSDQRRHAQKGKRATMSYLVCNNEATLLWMVNLGCIDINPWNSRTASPNEPDYLAIDLDPTVGDQPHGYLDKLLDTALAAKEWCDRHKIKAFAKTSGKTGIHFFIPTAGLNYSEVRIHAERICIEIQSLAPKSATSENTIARRGDNIYVDPSQNDYADTLAAAYSVRPFHTPMVSTPLEWKEIDRNLDPSRFTIDTIGTRLKKKGDLFAGIQDKNIAAANTRILNKY